MVEPTFTNIKVSAKCPLCHYPKEVLLIPSGDVEGGEARVVGCPFCDYVRCLPAMKGDVI
jgi:hypothetical protein